MRHHPVFENFQKTKCVGTGKHIFDFLGVATDVSYKKGWGKHAIKAGSEYTADYPPLNEHYFDWIAMLLSIVASSGTFRMAELGAGWAPWLVRAAFAARQLSMVNKTEFVGVEADPTHFGWVKDHFLDNGLDPRDFHLLHGAVSDTSEPLKFPKIANPDEDYGASTRAVTANSEYVEVPGYTLADLLSRFSGPIDFVHMDIQGAEYDVIPGSMALLKAKVKTMMVGTHISQEKHLELHQLFLDNAWEPVMIYPRNEEVQTEFGTVQFGDGFQFWKNQSTIKEN